MTMSIYIGAAIAFVVNTALILVLRPVARSFGLVDVPNERKIHEGAIPLVGGLAIFLAVLVAHGVALFYSDAPTSWGEYASFYAAGALLILAGIVDDIRELSPTFRISIEVIASLFVIYGAGAVVENLGTLAGHGSIVSLGIFAVPFTICAIVSLINAVNLSDGLDGLAGSLVLVSVLGFITAAAMFGGSEDVLFLVILATSIVAFLLFNVTVPGKRKASIFLGDSGSMFLGFSVAWMAIRFTQGEDAVLRPAAVLWLLMLPIFDTVCVMSRRIIRRRPPFSADKEHLHHIFLLAGFTVTETVMTMAGMAVVGVIVGILGTRYGVSDMVFAGLFLVLGLVYFWTILRAWTVMRFLRRSICRRRDIADRRTNAHRRRSGPTDYKGRDRRSLADRRRGERRQRST